MSNPLTRSSRKRIRREAEMASRPVVVRGCPCPSCSREGCEDSSTAVAICSEWMLQRTYRGNTPGRQLNGRAFRVNA